MFAQKAGDLEKRQSQNGIVTAANAGEEMHADGFNLVASRAAQRRRAKQAKINVHLIVGQRAHRHLVLAKMMPDPHPVTHDHCRGVKMMNPALKPPELRCRGRVISRLAKHLTINLEDLVGGKKKLPAGRGQTRLCGLTLHLGKNDGHVAGRNSLSSATCPNGLSFILR